MELKDLNGHTLLERSDQPKCGKEDFSQLYGTKVSFKDQALDSYDQMPVVDHLDSHQNHSRVVSALRSAKPGKAPGSDGIPAEILKLDLSHITSEIYFMLCLCWNTNMVPQDMKYAKFITLFKKGIKTILQQLLSDPLPS